MVLADYESRDINNTLSFDDIESILKNKPRITSIADAV